MSTISRRSTLSDGLSAFGGMTAAIGAVVVHGALIVVGTLFVWQQRARDRSLLAAMDDRMICDVGLSRADIYHETRKPFWRG